MTDYSARFVATYGVHGGFGCKYDETTSVPFKFSAKDSSEALKTCFTRACALAEDYLPTFDNHVVVRLAELRDEDAREGIDLSKTNPGGFVRDSSGLLTHRRTDLSFLLNMIVPVVPQVFLD